MTAELDIDHLRGWIGREQAADDLVAEDLARKYHATFDLPGDAPRSGQPVPRLIHFCLAQPAEPTAGLGPDGHAARGGFLPPVPLPRRMWAGGAITFRHDLKVGDAVRRVSRIDDVVMKQGRTGALCFVTVSHRMLVDGGLAVEERQDIVYSDPHGSGARAAQSGLASPGSVSRLVGVEAPLLFRYSALTFNGHRIHYDRRYAVDVEHYPGLVVHAPLQAALLLNLATEFLGAPPDHYVFRGVSPAFDTDALLLNAEPDGHTLRLWTAKKTGPVCMEATAH